MINGDETGVRDCEASATAGQVLGGGGPLVRQCDRRAARLRDPGAKNDAERSSGGRAVIASPGATTRGRRGRCWWGAPAAPSGYSVDERRGAAERHVGGVVAHTVSTARGRGQQPSPSPRAASPCRSARGSARGPSRSDRVQWLDANGRPRADEPHCVSPTASRGPCASIPRRCGEEAPTTSVPSARASRSPIRPRHCARAASVVMSRMLFTSGSPQRSEDAAHPTTLP